MSVRFSAQVGLSSRPGERKTRKNPGKNLRGRGEKRETQRESEKAGEKVRGENQEAQGSRGRRIGEATKIL